MSSPVFQPWDLFLLRAPVRAVEADGLTAGVPCHTREGYLQVLLAGLQRSELLEAVQLASPALHRQLLKVAAGNAKDIKTAHLRRAAMSLVRYDLRSRNRPTPFGLFAGVCGGRFDSTAKLAWDGGTRTRTHLDSDWLGQLVHRLEQQPSVLRHLRLQVHQSLTLRNGRVQLDTPTAGATDESVRAAVSVRATPPLRWLLLAAERPTPYDDLREQMSAAFPQATPDVIDTTLATLVAQEMLLTDLRPPLDGGDPLRHVLTVLQRVEQHQDRPLPIAAALRELDQLRRAYDAQPLGAGSPALHSLTQAAQEIVAHEHPLHIDTALDAEVRLPTAIAEEASTAMTVLWRLSSRRLGMRSLRAYHTLFCERLGVGRVVPLLDLLDDTAGLGAPAGYAWPRSDAPRPSEPPTDSAEEDARDRLLSRLGNEAVRNGADEVVLSDDLVERLSRGDDLVDVPASLEVYLHVVARSVQDLADGDYQLVLAPNPGSHTAGATFARFADMLVDHADLAAASARFGHPVDTAAAVNLAFAARSGRTGNLAHTVAYTGRRIALGLPSSTSCPEIPLNDIGVTATLERLLAVRLSTGEEIVPLAHHMVSPATQAPNAARLLWELGMEGQRLWEPWDWGSFARAPFLPRVRYRRTILSPATWKLDVLRAATGEDFLPIFAQWRRQWHVPRHVLALSNDQRLALDLDDPWHVELLVEEMGKNHALVVQEVAGSDPAADGWLCDGTGHHVAEVVVPMTRRPGLPPRRPAGLRLPTQSNRSRPLPHAPGGEWLYLKLYLPRRNQDELLREYLPTLISSAGPLGVDRWHFLRYADADGPHLRLRLHGEPRTLHSHVGPAVMDQVHRWRTAGLIGRTVIDEYDPEIERYGGPDALAAVERVFAADSAAACALLRLISQPTAGHDLHDAVTVSITALAAAFGAPDLLSPQLPAHLAGDSAAIWLWPTADERDVEPADRRRLHRWTGLLDPAGTWAHLRATPGGQPLLEALADRDTAVTQYGALVRALERDGRNPTPPVRIVGSLMHMTCNRLFGSAPSRELRAHAIARAAVLSNHERRRRT